MEQELRFGLDPGTDQPGSINLDDIIHSDVDISFIC